MSSRIALLVCRHLEQEAKAACRLCRWGDVSVTSFRERCEHRWSSWDEVLEAIPESSADAELVVVGAACLPGGEASLPGVARVVRAETCFGLLANASLVDHWMRDGSHLVTPGWLRGWREDADARGRGPRAAREQLAESARSIRLLDTLVEPSVAADLADFGAFVGLDTAIEPVGLDLFMSRLNEAVVEVRASRQVEDALVHTAETSMLLDLSAELMDVGSEEELLTKVGELIRMLLPPCICRVASVRHGKVEQVSANVGGVDGQWFKAHLEASSALTMLPDDQGFALQLRHRDDVVGIVEVTRLASTDRVAQYANAVLSMSGICGAAIIRCRALAGIISICASCKRIRGARGWEPVDVYLHSHTDADFSHGLCPECIERLYPDTTHG